MRKPMTLDEFLAWEERQDARWEFNGFAPVARIGGTQEHSTIQANLITALGIRLRGTGCRAYGSDFKIEVDGSIRYPDAFVRCSQSPRGTTLADDPIVVFEILSPSPPSSTASSRPGNSATPHRSCAMSSWNRPPWRRRCSRIPMEFGPA